MLALLYGKHDAAFFKVLLHIKHVSTKVLDVCFSNNNIKYEGRMCEINVIEIHCWVKTAKKKNWVKQLQSS